MYADVRTETQMLEIPYWNGREIWKGMLGIVYIFVCLFFLYVFLNYTSLQDFYGNISCIIFNTEFESVIEISISKFNPNFHQI